MTSSSWVSGPASNVGVVEQSLIAGHVARFFAGEAQNERGNLIRLPATVLQRESE